MRRVPESSRRAAASLRPSMEKELPSWLADRLCAYLELLLTWNRVYRLVGERSPERLWRHHISASLAVLPWVSGPRCLDVGSGAGLPGLILALAQPETSWVLLDSRLKPSRFLLQAVCELGVENIEVVRTRAECYRPLALFDTVTARAVSSLAGIWQLAGGLCAPQGKLLALKGQQASAELGALKGLRISVQLHSLPTGTMLVELSKSSASGTGPSVP